MVRSYLRETRGGIPFGVEQIEIMLRVIESNRRPVERFADLGCGGGALAQALLARYPAAHATLVDFSEPMLAAARAAVRAQTPSARFVTADLAAPSWAGDLDPDASFDAIVSAYAIHHLTHERKRELYGEIFDRLEPGGIFVNIEHVQSSAPAVEAMSDDLMIECLHGFQAKQPGAKTREQIADEFHRRPDKAANILAPVEMQCGWLRAIGFADVDCYFKVFELAVFGGQRPTA
ncbi:MAG TPA: class I SAM-dependent methyltransferase [Candidatus Binatia bacterium]|nr:class I SAM-dependent methyltransferase [Candidatus Binatia bacterium]